MKIFRSQFTLNANAKKKGEKTQKVYWRMYMRKRNFADVYPRHPPKDQER